MIFPFYGHSQREYTSTVAFPLHTPFLSCLVFFLLMHAAGENRDSTGVLGFDMGGYTPCRPSDAASVGCNTVYLTGHYWT